MSAHKKEAQINLLPQKGFASSTTGRVLAWILSTFRIIVIATELIVMIAFLSRFWLDAQNTDLEDEIRDKQAALEASQTFEQEFKDVQERLKIYSQIALRDKKPSPVLNLVANYLPSDVFVNTITFDLKGIAITGLSPNEKSVYQYIVNLQSIEDLSEVSLVGIKSDEQSPEYLDYKINTTYKN